MFFKFFKKEKQKKEISTFKAARRALIASIVSLVVCFSMLSGTTFAWFTDSVTSGKNKIEAGYTDFEVKKYVSDSNGEGSYTGKVDANTKVFSGEQWNLGDVRVAYYKIINTGNLDIILNVDLIAKAAEDQQKTVGDLSDYMVLKAIISNDDPRPDNTTTEEELKTQLINEAGINVGTKNFKTNLFPEDSENNDPNYIEPNDSVYVKVIAYLPDFESGTQKPLIYKDKYNAQMSKATCKFSMTVNAFQVIEDVNITYKTFVWSDNNQDSSSDENGNKLALKQVPKGNIKVWKKVDETEEKVYAFDQDSLQAALSIRDANVVVLNDIFVTNWNTIDSFSGTIESSQNKQFTIWGLNRRMIDTFNGTIRNIVFKNCVAQVPHEIKTLSPEESNFYNGVLAATADNNAKIENVDVLYSTIGSTIQNVSPNNYYIGALVGWMNKEATINNDCIATNNNPNNIEIIGHQEQTSGN